MNNTSSFTLDKIQRSTMEKASIHQLEEVYGSCISKCDAISLNDNGIWLLNTGRPQEAMATFRTALQEVRSMFPSSSSLAKSPSNDAKNLLPATTPDEQTTTFHSSNELEHDHHGDIDMQVFEECEEDNEDDDSDEINGYFTSTLVVQSIKISYPCYNKSADSSSSSTASSSFDESPLVMYDRVIQVSIVSNSEDNNWSLFDRQLLASVVTYNMAVVCHRIGISNGLSPARLKKAVELYKISCHIIQEQLEYEQFLAMEEDDDDSVDDMLANCHASISLLLLAGYNNMAHISSILYNINDMESYLEGLRNILCDCTEDKIQSPILDSDEYCIFLMNIMMTAQSKSLIHNAPAA